MGNGYQKKAEPAVISFSKNLSRLMIDNKTKQGELGRIINCDRTTVSNLMNGKAKPNIVQLERIAKYFNVSIDYLAGLTEENNYNEWIYSEFLHKLTGNTKIYEKILDCFFDLVRYKTKADKDFYSNNTPIDDGYPTPEVAAHLYAHKIGMYVTEILDEYIDAGYVEGEPDIYSAVIEELKEGIRNKQSENDAKSYFLRDLADFVGE